MSINETKYRTVVPGLNQGLFLLGSETMKALILINAGSAAALLAFIGHLVSSDRTELAKKLAMPLAVFLISALLAAGSFGFSYLSQACTNMAFEYLFPWNEGDCWKYDALVRKGTRFRRLAVAVTAAAFIAGFAGICASYRAFMSF